MVVFLEAWIKTSCGFFHKRKKNEAWGMSQIVVWEENLALHFKVKTGEYRSLPALLNHIPSKWRKGAPRRR